MTALAPATKIRPERSGRVPLAQAVDAMHPHDNRYYGTDERHGYVQSDLHGSHLVFGSWALRSKSSQEIVGRRPLRPRPTFVSAPLKIDINARSLRARQAVKFIVFRIVQHSASHRLRQDCPEVREGTGFKMVANCRKQTSAISFAVSLRPLANEIDRD